MSSLQTVIQAPSMNRYPKTWNIRLTSLSLGENLRRKVGLCDIEVWKPSGANHPLDLFLGLPLRFRVKQNHKQECQDRCKNLASG